MKLTTNTNITVDGVMQGLGGPDEDRRGGFERGGWVMDKFDPEALPPLDEIYGRADAFLFGRRTYEIFAGSWGTLEELRAQPIGVALNARPKYVASTTPFDPTWANTTVLSGDVAAAIRELKAKPGGELQVPGSASLSAGCSRTTSSTRSPCSRSRWSSARECGCSRTMARKRRSTWCDRRQPPAE